jgi:RsiW-degrading membrane proteinase PrsW (M82 family)
MNVIEFGIIFLLSAFAPSIFILLWIRSREKFDREPLTTVLFTFLYGATVCVFAAIILEFISLIIFSRNFQWLEQNIYVKTGLTIEASSVIIAPLIEEALKPVGVYRLRNRKCFNEISDGVIYGSASGLGFASTENIVYFYMALMSGGIPAWIMTAVVRTVSSILLHASATSITGLGISKHIVEKRTSGFIVLGYLGAVVLHAVFNFLASTMETTVLAIFLSIVVFLLISQTLRK